MVRRAYYKETSQVVPFYAGGPFFVCERGLLCLHDTCVCCVDPETSVVLQRRELDGELLTALCPRDETTFLVASRLQLYALELADFSPIPVVRLQSPIITLIHRGGLTYCGCSRGETVVYDRDWHVIHTHRGIGPTLDVSVQPSQKVTDALFVSISTGSPAVLHCLGRSVALTEGPAHSSCFIDDSTLLVSVNECIIVYRVWREDGVPRFEEARVVAAYTKFRRMILTGEHVLALNDGDDGGLMYLTRQGSIVKHEGQPIVVLAGENIQQAYLMGDQFIAATEDSLLHFLPLCIEPDTKPARTLIGGYGSCSSLCVLDTIREGSQQELALLATETGLWAFEVTATGLVTVDITMDKEIRDVQFVASAVEWNRQNETCYLALGTRAEVYLMRYDHETAGMRLETVDVISGFHHEITAVDLMIRNMSSAALAIGDNEGFVHIIHIERALRGQAIEDDRLIHKLPKRPLTLSIARSLEVAAGGDDRMLHFVGKAVKSHKAHKRTLTRVAFTHDRTFGEDRSLLSCSYDGTVRLWNKTDSVVLQGHLAPVMTAEFIGMNDITSQCVSADTDGVLKVWDCVSRECLSTLKVTDQRVTGLLSFAKGDRLLITCMDGTLITLEDHTEEVRREEEEERERLMRFQVDVDNAIRSHEYAKALRLVIHGGDRKLLSRVLQTIYTECPAPENEIRSAVAEVSLVDTAEALESCAKLSASSRGAVLVQDLVFSLFKKYGITTLVTAFADNVHMLSVVELLTLNMSKHLNRIARLAAGVMDARIE